MPPSGARWRFFGTDERIAELTILFRTLRPLMQGQVLRSTMQLAMSLPDLYAAIAAAANARERGKSSYFDAD